MNPNLLKENSKEITQIKKKKKQQAREDSIAESVKTSTAPAVIWQAILYYKGVEAPQPNTDSLVELFSVQYINAPDGQQGDRYHPRQKPLEIADRFISHSAQPGDTVIDPFACTGTSLISASRLGRLSSGCDISDENIEIARGSYLIY